MNTKMGVEDLLRQEVLTSGLPLDTVARRAGLSQPLLWRFVKVAGAGIHLRNAEKLMILFDLEVRKRRRQP
jgi:hypothetical protein